MRFLKSNKWPSHSSNSFGKLERYQFQDIFQRSACKKMVYFVNSIFVAGQMKILAGGFLLPKVEKYVRQ